MNKGRKAKPSGSLSLDKDVRVVKRIVRLLWPYDPQGRWNLLKAVDEVLVARTVALKRKRDEN